MVLAEVVSRNAEAVRFCNRKYKISHLPLRTFYAHGNNVIHYCFGCEQTVLNSQQQNTDLLVELPVYITNKVLQNS